MNTPDHIAKSLRMLGFKVKKFPKNEKLMLYSAKNKK